MTPYRHTQYGWVNVGLAAVIFGVTTAVLGAGSAAPTAILVIAVTALLLFSVLTVTVDATHVSARLGIGLIKRRIPLTDVVSVTPVRNRWWHGWGVRVIPGGIMYGVYGLSAVELVLTDGSRFRIGTDEPDALTRAINQRRPGG